MPQGDPQILGRNLLALNQLRLKFRTLLSECLGELSHDLGDQQIGLFDRPSGLVDEACLDLQPPRPEFLGRAVRKERNAASPG